MNKTAVMKAKETAEKIISARNDEINQIQAKIKDADAAEAKAKEAINQAVSNGDEMAYQNAKSTIALSNDRREMYNAQLEMLKKKQLVSDSDYRQTISAIMAEMDALKLKQERRLVELVNEFAKIGEESKAAIAEANKVMWTWQHELHLDKDLHYSHIGEPFSAELKQYRDAIVELFTDEVVTSGYYTDTILKEVRKGK